MKDCTRETLASSEGCRIERCGCGTVHLTIGAVTVRLTREDFESVAKTTVEAATKLLLRPRNNRVARLLEE